jgi:hypothetical protein
MGLFNHKKKADPISERSRELTAEIAALEAQIKELDDQMLHAPPPPRLRSPALPHQSAASGALPRLREPVFEEVDHDRVKDETDSATTPSHYNELGVRKFDLVAVWRSLHKHIHGPSANNPKLVNYLAAGSIQGLRPLRYEKRVARNRVIALTAILIGVLWGILEILHKR